MSPVKLIKAVNNVLNDPQKPEENEILENCLSWVYEINTPYLR